MEINNNGIMPNLETQIQITENDVQGVMNEHPLFKVMVENKALRRIIENQSQRLKDVQIELEKFQDPKKQIVPPFLDDVPKSKVKKNG